MTEPIVFPLDTDFELDVLNNILHYTNIIEQAIVCTMAIYNVCVQF